VKHSKGTGLFHDFVKVILGGKPIRCDQVSSVSHDGFSSPEFILAEAIDVITGETFMESSY